MKKKRMLKWTLMWWKWWCNKSDEIGKNLRIDRIDDRIELNWNGWWCKMVVMRMMRRMRMMRMTKVVMEKVFWKSSFVEVLCKLLLTQSIAQCRISTSFPPLLDAIQCQKHPRTGLTNNQTALSAGCDTRLTSFRYNTHPNWFIWNHFKFLCVVCWSMTELKFWQQLYWPKHGTGVHWFDISHRFLH